MKRVILVLILLGCLLLAGCGPNITEGVIVGKKYIPKRKVYQPIYMVVNKRTRIIPRWVTHGEVWRVTVEKDDKRQVWDVSESYYNSVRIGDYAVRPGYTPMPKEGALG